MAKPITHAEWQVWIANAWGKAVEAARAQKEWVGLTDEEIQSLADKHKEPLLFRFAEFARAIEAKLKEKNHAG